GFGNIGNTAVDDDTGIKELKGFAGTRFTAEDAPEGGQVEGIAFVGADGDTEIDQGEQATHFEKVEGGGLVRINGDQNEGNEKGAENSEESADGCPQQAFERQPLDSLFNQKSGSCED